MSSRSLVVERLPGVWEVMGSIPVVDSEFFFVPRSRHVEYILFFHISLPSLKFTIFIYLTSFLLFALQFSMIMQYDYKHIATALVRGGQESEEQLVTLKHKLHINLGPVDSES